MIELLANVCAYGFRQKASEVYLREGCVPALNLHGQVMVIPGAPALEKDALHRHLWPALSSEGRELLETRGWLESPVVFPGLGVVWVVLGTDVGGAYALVRPLPWESEDIQLRIPESVLLWRQARSGLVVLNGGCAATSWRLGWEFIRTYLEGTGRVALLLDKTSIGENLDLAGGVLLREAPSENPFAQLRRWVARGIRLIWLPSLRGQWAHAALEAAEAGCLVVAGSSSSSTGSVLDWISECGDETGNGLLRTLLSANLRGVALVRMVRGKDSAEVFPAWEVLANTPQVGQAIRAGEFQRMAQYIKAGAAEGMQSLDESLALLVHQKKIDISEALRYASEVALFEARS